MTPQFIHIIKDYVVPELVDIHNMSVKVFFDGDLANAKSYVQSPNIIVLDIKNLTGMVDGIRCVCHEYCHLLREYQVSSDFRIQGIHDFYLKECREYYEHDQTALGYQVYWYSLLELDARAFEETLGTVCTDHYFELLSPSQLREAYEDKGAQGLVNLVRYTYHV